MKLAEKLVSLADKLEKVSATLVIVNEQVQQALVDIRDEVEKLKASKP